MPVANGFDDVPTTKSHSARSIATHPCRKRKDGAPSVRIVHARIIEGGPPAWRFTHYVMVYSQVNRSFFLFILRKPEVDDQFKVKTQNRHSAREVLSASFRDAIRFEYEPNTYATDE